MEKDLKYTCDDCGHSWLMSQYTEAEDQVEYRDGFHCPKCDSTEISGEDIKN